MQIGNKTLIMIEVRKLKQLQSHLKSMVADADVLKIEYTNKQREYTQKLQLITKLKEEIAKLNNVTTVKVSEHAIVRYFERVKGYNIEDIEKEILSESLLSLVTKLGGNGTFPSGNFSVKMKNFTITTIV